MRFTFPVLLVLTATLTACGTPVVLTPVGTTAAPAVTAAHPAPENSAPIISLTDYQTNSARYHLIDSRPASSFAVEHAAGAENVPLADLGTLAPNLPRDKQLLVYCTCDDEGLALKVAGKLIADYGLKDVFVLKGGLAAWKDGGLAVAGTTVTPAK